MAIVVTTSSVAVLEGKGTRGKAIRRGIMRQAKIGVLSGIEDLGRDSSIVVPSIVIVAREAQSRAIRPQITRNRSREDSMTSLI